MMTIYIHTEFGGVIEYEPTPLTSAYEPAPWGWGEGWPGLAQVVRQDDEEKTGERKAGVQ